MLYHSFPRPSAKKVDNCEANEIALRQLESFIEWGLILTPEILVLPANPQADNVEPPETKFPQARACFTLAERSELTDVTARRDRYGATKSHSDLFGTFAIGLDPLEARYLGAVPTIYFYRTDNKVNVSFEMLYHLRELRSLAIALSCIERKAEIPGRDVLDPKVMSELNMQLKGDPDVAKTIEETSIQDARFALRFFDTDRPPAWNLVDWIDGILDFCQTADSDKLDGSLSYYQQREWRIIHLFSHAVHVHRLGSLSWLDGSAEMPARERKRLIKSLKAKNSKFFTNERIEGCSLLQGARFEGRDVPFFDFIREIVCPSSARSEVSNILSQYGLRARFSTTEVHGDITIFEYSEGQC